MTVRTRPSARCRKLLLELSRLLDGDLTPARRRKVEKHVSACDCCGTMAARLRRTVAACRDEGSRRPPRAVMSRAAVRVRALLANSEQRPRNAARARSAPRQIREHSPRIAQTSTDQSTVAALQQDASEVSDVVTDEMTPSGDNVSGIRTDGKYHF